MILAVEPFTSMGNQVTNDSSTPSGSPSKANTSSSSVSPVLGISRKVRRANMNADRQVKILMSRSREGAQLTFPPGHVAHHDGQLGRGVTPAL